MPGRPAALCGGMLSVGGWRRSPIQLRSESRRVNAELRFVARHTRPRVRVLFLHGLTGDLEETWDPRAGKNGDDRFWPHWIVDEVEASSVGLLGYPAPLTAFLEKSPSKQPHEIARDLLRRLDAERFLTDGPGSRPLVMICHSLGGVIAKQMLRESLDDSSLQGGAAFARDLRGVVFIATPHDGSGWANFSRVLGTSLQTRSIERSATWASNLRDYYKGISLARSIRTHAFYETAKTPLVDRRFARFIKGLVVNRESADPRVSDCIPIAVDGANHNTICKPRSNKSDIHVSTRDFLEEVVRRRQLEPTRKLTARKERALESFQTALTETQEYVDARNLVQSRNQWREKYLGLLWGIVAERIVALDPGVADSAQLKADYWTEGHAFDPEYPVPLEKEFSLEMMGNAFARLSGRPSLSRTPADG